MKFDEVFPSLKNDVWRMKYVENDTIFDCIPLNEIEKFCLDKERVKQAIKKQIQIHDEGECLYDSFTELLKELGLE